MNTADIDIQRQAIDAIDAEILTLLNARSRAVQHIGELKKISGKAVKDPKREQAILDRLTALSNGPLSKDGIEEIWQTIFAVSRKMEHSITKH